MCQPYHVTLEVTYRQPDVAGSLKSGNTSAVPSTTVRRSELWWDVVRPVGFRDSRVVGGVSQFGFVHRMPVLMLYLSSVEKSLSGLLTGCRYIIWGSPFVPQAGQAKLGSRTVRVRP